MPSSPALGAATRLPPHQREFLEAKFPNEDMDPHALALLFATFQALVRVDVAARVRSMYKQLGKDYRVSLSAEETVELVHACLAFEALGENTSQLTHEQVEAMRASIAQDPITLKLLSGLVSATMGYHVDEQVCTGMEDQLMALQESSNRGRVRLSKIYQTYLEEGTPYFDKSLEFLRQQGVLDESNPAEPLVLIPNFLVMRAHCRTEWKYYDLCCQDLCGDILDLLEDKVRAPLVSAEDILHALASKPFEHYLKGRGYVSPALELKLQEIAKHHGGKVPLHGRLFAQWLHFAFPSMCPYPHLSGAIMPTTAQEWIEKTGTAAVATREQMLQIINRTDREDSATSCDDPENGMCMWRPDEEMVDAAGLHAQWSEKRSVEAVQWDVMSCLRIVALLSAIGAAGVSMSNLLKDSTLALFTASKPPAILAKILDFKGKDASLML